MYIDHRVDPGPPRPGYLERIIDGALHHGLPHRWIEFLRRWDPSQWPVPKDNSRAGAPQSLSELLADSGVLEEMHAAFPVRLHGDPRRWTGADDRRHRRTRCRRGRRIGVPVAPSGELPASPAVGALPGRGVRAARGVPRPRRRRDLAARLRPVGPQYPAARRRPQPRARRTPRPALHGARLPRRHRPRCDPPRAARAASRQPGQPRARRRRPARTLAAAARHQPAQRACRRRRTVPADIRPDPGARRGRAQLETQPTIQRHPAHAASLRILRCGTK